MAIRYKLIGVHLFILSLLGLLVYSLVTFNNATFQLASADLRAGIGPRIIGDAPRTVEQGGTLKFQRLIKAEPQGCRIVIDRYLIPLADENQSIFIGTFERTSKPEGTIHEVEVGIPYSIPPGLYLYQGQGRTYCSWLNYVFGPHHDRTIPFVLEVTPGKL